MPSSTLIKHFLDFIVLTFLPFLPPLIYLPSRSGWSVRYSRTVPLLGGEGFLGKSMSLEQYMLVCRDSGDLFHLLVSTGIPMVQAALFMYAGHPYLLQAEAPADSHLAVVPHRGASHYGPYGSGCRAALAGRALHLRIFYADWFNHMKMHSCQFLWKWGFRIMPFGAFSEGEPLYWKTVVLNL